MKHVTVLFAVVIAVALSSINGDTTQAIISECTKILDLEEQKVNGFFNTKIKNLKNVETPLKNFLVCLYTKMDILNDDGEIVISTLKKGLDANYHFTVVEEMIRKCTDKKDTPQETALELYKCLTNEDKKVMRAWYLINTYWTY